MKKLWYSYGWAVLIIPFMAALAYFVISVAMENVEGSVWGVIFMGMGMALFLAGIDGLRA